MRDHSMPVPPALISWLKGTYPTLEIDTQWLEDCVEYLQSNTEGANAIPTLIKRVDEQLVLSDLKDSVAPPGPLASLTDGDHGHDLSQTRGVLVQITAITDIGHSAISLREAHQKRKEESAGGPVVVGNVEEDQQGPTKFPRGMLSLQLSDGHTIIKGIEYEKLPFLEMGDTTLGAKLLLKACKVRRGIALLTPTTAIWKKGGVHEMQELSDQAYADSFDARIQAQKDHKPAPRPTKKGKQPNKPAVKAAPAARRPPAQAKKQAERAIELDDDEDLFELDDEPPPPKPRAKAAPAARARPAQPSFLPEEEDEEEEDMLGNDDLDAAMAEFEAGGSASAQRKPQPKPPPVEVDYNLNSDDDMFFDDDGFLPKQAEPAPSKKAPIKMQPTVIDLSSSQ